METSQQNFPRNRAEYLTIVGYEPSVLAADISTIMDPQCYRPHSSKAVCDSISSIADHMRIYEWYDSPRSDLRIVESGLAQGSVSKSSTLSVFAASQQQRLIGRRRSPGIVLCWCCSEHAQDPLQVMLKSLLGQLLSKITRHASVPVLETFQEAINSNNVGMLAPLLNLLILEQLQYSAMILIVEDMSCYEAGPQQQGFVMVFEMVASILRLPSSYGNCAFKVLMTTSLASTVIGDRARVYGFPPEDVRDVITCNLLLA